MLSAGSLARRGLWEGGHDPLHCTAATRMDMCASSEVELGLPEGSGGLKQEWEGVGWFSHHPGCSKICDAVRNGKQGAVRLGKPPCSLWTVWLFGPGRGSGMGDRRGPGLGTRGHPLSSESCASACDGESGEAGPEAL